VGALLWARKSDPSQVDHRLVPAGRQSCLPFSQPYPFAVLGVIADIGGMHPGIA